MSLINKDRPPVFCPGCSHDLVVKILDRAFTELGLTGERVVIVSDIGCSGLFDTFFNTHAFHGLHGRALTYAAGLKLARPDLNVIVTMGDGGLGIGGAHWLAACRRNLDITLLVLNNYNFGMTGGQFSVTTPESALSGSGFLNKLEQPADLVRVAAAAGAEFVRRVSPYSDGAVGHVKDAVNYHGFAIVELPGICPGRYTAKNRLTPADINKMADENSCSVSSTPAGRREYGDAYRAEAAKMEPAGRPAHIRRMHEPVEFTRKEVLILGSAGQRIGSAGELLCLAGMSSGFNVAQKSEYNITVLRGPSISEVILDMDDIDYTGIDRPSVILALAGEGVQRRIGIFDGLDERTLVVKAADVDMPGCGAVVRNVDFKALGIKPAERGLAGLAMLAKQETIITIDMLKTAINERYSGGYREEGMKVIERTLV